MTDNEKIDMVASVLSVSADSINEKTELASLDEYDSMMKLSIIIMFVDEFEKKLTLEEVKGFKTVKDIMDKMA